VGPDLSAAGCPGHVVSVPGAVRSLGESARVSCVGRVLSGCAASPL